MDNKPFTTLNFTDLGSPFGGPNEDPPGTPTMSGEGHIGPPTPHESNNSTPVSKSAFIELQQHGYGPLRTSYQHHFNSPAGNAHSGPTGGHDTGFPSPRGALGGYPFPPMQQHSYTGYHLGSYASNCPPSPKDDGKYPTAIVSSELTILTTQYLSSIFLSPLAKVIEIPTNREE